MHSKIILFALGALLVFFTFPSFAQEDDKLVILNTSSGKIVIEFFPDDAPKHVENFIKLTEDH